MDKALKDHNAHLAVYTPILPVPIELGYSHGIGGVSAQFPGVAVSTSTREKEEYPASWYGVPRRHDGRRGHLATVK